MRNFLALAPILLGLASASALALDDTPTVAPHFQIKGEDLRQAGARLNPAPAPRRATAEAEPAKPEQQAPNPRAVTTTVLRPLPASSQLLVERPRGKMR